MCHGSSLLEEFFAGKAFQEVKEKASSTDAKSMEKRTEGLHQAQYSVKFKAWLSSWVPNNKRLCISMGFFFWHFFCLSHVTTQSSLVLAFGKLLLQVLAEVQKQMGSFDAELKDGRRRAEEMQQAPCFLMFFLPVVRLSMFSIRTKLTGGFNLFFYVHLYLGK